MPFDAFIYDAIRSPRGKGKAGGALHEVKPVSLIVGLLDELKDRHDLDTSRVDDVIMGCATPVGEQGSVLPRIAILSSSWSQQVTGAQVNRFCASGLETVNLAAMKIASGWEDLVVAGGFESMSRVKMAADGGAWYQDPEANVGSEYLPQGVSADLVATLDGFSRTDVDNYALRSQQRATAAQKAGYFDKSLVPVKDRNGLTILDHDEFVRPNSSLEGLGKLPPAFEAIGASGPDEAAILRYPEIDRIDHVHTGGNSSGIVDGAGLVLLGNEKIGTELGIAPRGRIVATALIGSEPTIMLTGPVPVTHKVLNKAGLSLDDIDLFELNEAFASVVMHYQKELGIPDEKINVNGGAIAMGHPLGATGAMILGTCLDELERRQQRYGLVSLCAAAGMGIATIIERV